MKTQIISIYRRKGMRHLTVAEMNLARETALACGEHSQLVIDDGDFIQVPIHMEEVEAPTSMDAMALYRDQHPTAEILFGHGNCPTIVEI